MNRVASPRTSAKRGLTLTAYKAAGLGTVDDADVARTLDVSRQAVKYMRGRLGVAAVPRRNKHAGTSMGGQPRTTPEPAPVAGARWIPLTKQQFVLVDAADFAALSRWKWSYSDGYAIRGFRIGGRAGMLKIHRVVVGVDDPRVQVDHRDRNRLDCRRENLRIATVTQNNRNRSIGRRNASGFKGVVWDADRNKWRAQIGFNHRFYILGRYDDPAVAARAYDAAANNLFGAFSAPNFKEA